MTTINIIGVVMLIGSVLGYGALFLWVITADKRKARKKVFCLISGKTSSPGNITATLLGACQVR